MLNPTVEQIETLKDLFLKKLEKDGAPCEGGFHPDDIERVKTSHRWLQLFLEHVDLDMKQALTMAWETCIWRKTYGTNEICEKNTRVDYLESGIVFPYKTDVDGKILLIFKSKAHTKGTRDIDELIKCVVYWIERLHRQTNYDQLTLVFDMQSCGISNMDMDFTKRIIDTFKLYYPNSLNYIIIFEMAWILNAAFKLVKTLLPPKAVAKMKFVNLKNIKEFIPESNLLKNWGGNDDYQFKFEPENREKLIEKSSESLPITSNGLSPTAASAKKVHFANSNPIDSPMNPNTANGSNANSCDLLKLKPDDIIIFKKIASNYVGSVEIHNISQNHVTYKIKTTAPEKFRVRPTTGIILPYKKDKVDVTLQQEYKCNLLQEKFLVMCMALSEDDAANNQSTFDIWKNTPTPSPNVEQHRLRCALADVPGDATTYGPTNDKEFNYMRNINSTIYELSETTNRLHQEVKVTRRLQWTNIILLLVISIISLYLFKFEGQNSLRNEL